MDKCPRCEKQIGQRRDDDSEDEDDDDIRADTNTVGHMTGCFHIICPSCFPDHTAEIEELMANEMQELCDAGDDDPNVNTYTCPYCRTEDIKFMHYTILQSELDAEAERKRRIQANPKLARQMGFYKGPHTKTQKLISYLKEFEAESHSKPKEAPIKRQVPLTRSISTLMRLANLVQCGILSMDISS